MIVHVMSPVVPFHCDIRLGSLLHYSACIQQGWGYCKQFAYFPPIEAAKEDGLILNLGLYHGMY